MASNTAEEGAMANRRLENGEPAMAAEILRSVRSQIAEASGGDLELAWALRRKVCKELIYDERSKPAHRRKLKALKRVQQDGICPICRKPLPEKYVILDRLEAMAGYTPGNTRLIHQQCDIEIQASRGFS